MTLTLWLGASALLFGIPEESGKAPYIATIAVPEAEVRSGAGNSPQLYSTNRLHKGDKVKVVKELEGGWLAIEPPPGSFSWINARFVKQITPARPVWMVVAHPDARVPLLLGSDIRSTKPTVEGVRVMRGTQLHSIGPMRSAEDGRWLPVEPPPSEVRYLRAEAISRTAPATQTAATPPAAAAVAGTERKAPAAAPVAGASTRIAAPPATRAAAGYPIPAPGSRSASSPLPAGVPAGWVSSGPGRLTRAGNFINYQRAYMLLNSQGWPSLYVTSREDYSLESYVGRNVELYGVRDYRTDLRAWHMTAMLVKLLP